VTAIVAPLLAVRRVLHEQFVVLDRMVAAQARRDKICCRLMTAPGVGPVVALTFRAAVDQPRRFARSKAVGAHFGLTPRRFQPGETDYDGRISKCGDAAMRTALYEATQVLLTRTQKWCWLKAWGTHLARRRGGKRAIIALARRLAVVLHRMWIDGTDFRWRKETSTATA
jgi:transposase